MRIVSFGCSLTFGTELGDGDNTALYPTASKLTWPALVAARLGMDYQCRALGGAGNLAIMDRVLNHAHYDAQDFFVINWTFVDRFDYSAPDGAHFGRGKNAYATLRPGDSDSISQFYYRRLHSEYRDKLTNLVYVKTVLDCLLQQHTRFLMTAVDDLLMCQRWHVSPQVTDLQQAIAPWIHQFDHRNFLDWSRHGGFAITPAGHPLTAAHEAAADVMQPIIDAILHRV